MDLIFDERFSFISHRFSSIVYDNQSTIQMLQNPMHHKWTKHIDIGCHFACVHDASGLIHPLSMDSRHQLVDIFTKALGP